MPVAEIFISAIVTILFEKLASLDLLNFARREGLYTEINKWRGMLLKINTMLTDAEDQQLKNKSAQLWLKELQDLSYDLDDVLDEFATEQIKMKLDGLIPFQPSTIKGKLKAFLPGCCTGDGFLSPSSFLFNSEMKSKINNISARLDSITRQVRDLNLDITGRTSANKPASQSTPTTSLLHAPKVCGRDKERNNIIEFLLIDDDSGQGNDKIGVVPIVGMGGIGKTTLAQTVYNDDNVKKHFSLRAWVCVSEEFDVMRLTKTILEAVTSKSCNLINFDQIQVELKKSLAGKKCIIVLDDVWHIDDHDWSILKSPFGDAARGSKVIVTTRDENVAKLMRSSKHNHHSLQPLPFDDSWSVFVQHAFENRDMNENAKLLEIGMQIVERCKGLPLSARALGGLLRSKEDEVEWKDVLDSEIWWEKDNKILASLRLSYHHLPSYLKPCFCYCSIIPKNYQFGKKELVYLWMAEGLVQQGRERKLLEDIGYDYFHEILSRSLFQPSHTEGDHKSFVMHDLISDFAQEVSGDLSFRLDNKLDDQVRSRNLERARHSSFLQGNFDSIQKFESYTKAKHLRTFLPFSSWALGHGYKMATNVPSILFPKLKRLRVLSLRHYQSIELPHSIGDMKHLRYLDLSFTDIEKLPDWLQTLFNLQTLILRECRKLKNLPGNMGNLIQLRYFDVTNTYVLREMPLGIGNMVNLQMLSDFIVTKDKGSRIKELGKLRHIGETLRLSGLQNVTNPLDANEAYLIEKKHLDGLRFVYDEITNEIPNEVVEREVLHMLQPHNKLKELHISWYHGTRFPAWLENPMFTDLVEMEIRDCTNCSVLPPLGQLKSLKKLYIQGMSGVKHVGLEFYGQICPNPFPVLESLTFNNMPEWEDWFSFGVNDRVKPFATVSQLLILRCPKLVGKLPTDLPNLKFLGIELCKKFVVEFDSLVYPPLTFISVNGVELGSVLQC